MSDILGYKLTQTGFQVQQILDKADDVIVNGAGIIKVVADEYYGDGSHLTGIATSLAFNDLTSSAHTHTIADVSNLQTSLDGKASLTPFNSHTGDTSIHFTKNSINLSDLSNTAHTHTIANVTNLQTSLDSKTNLTSFNSHTGDTSIHFTKNSINLSDLGNTAHTHTIANVTNLQTSLDSKLNLTGGTLSGNLTGTTIVANTISATTYIGVDTTEVLNLSTLSGTTLTDVLNTATVATDGLTLNNTDIILGLREELVEGVNKQVNKFWQGNLFTKQKMFIAYDRSTPSASDDFVIFVPDVNITITKVYFVTKATTVAFNINHSSNVDIWTSDKTATITTQLSDVINNPNCLAGMPIKYQASAIGTTPLNIHMTIYYTED